MSQNRRDTEMQAKAFRLYAATKLRHATPSITVTNATTKGLYRGSSMASPRHDADNHFKHPSLGLTVQIERV